MSRHGLPVIAVGGGIAGAAFATELARSGCRVILLERTSHPSHKVCGEFLSQDAQAALAALGIDARALGATRIDRFRLVKRERYAEAPLPFAAAGLSRLCLDEALLAAAERAGATVVRGAAVTGIDATGGEVVARTERREWRSAAAELGTGKHAMRGLRRAPGEMVGFKLHLEATPAAARDLSGVVQLVFFRGGYAGACLVEGGVLSVAWVMRASLVRAVGPRWSAQEGHLARQSGLIGDLLAGARPLFANPAAVASIPYGYLRAQPIAPNVFPLGDQLAVVPSFTGDGIAIALRSGVAAARALLAGQSAAAHQHRMVEMLRPQLRLAGVLGRLLETPSTCGIGVAAARLLPGLVTRIVAATRMRAPD